MQIHSRESFGDIAGMTCQIRRAHQLAKGPACQRTGDKQCVGDTSIPADGAALNIDLDAETQRIGPGESVGAHLAKEGIVAEHRSMRGTGGEDDRIERRGLPRPAVPRTQIDRQCCVLPRVSTNRGGPNFQRAFTDPARDHGINLRRDSKSISIPERAQMANESGALVQRQCPPDIESLQPHLIQHRMPRFPVARGVGDDAADMAQQRERGAGRITREIAKSFAELRSVSLRAQAAPR